MKSKGRNLSSAESEITKIQELMYELRVEEIMTRPVITVIPDASMRQAKELMRFRRISGVPVVIGDALVGIVSVEDVIRWLELGATNATVSDWMTKDVFTVKAEEAAVHAINRFATFKVGRLPVVDRAGNLVGIVTPGDIMNKVVRILDALYRDTEQRRYRRHFHLDELISDETTIALRYQVASGDLDNAGAAATRIKRVLEGLGMDPKIVRRAGITAYEAEMNLAIHTLQGGWLRAEISPTQLLIETEDDGPGIDDLDAALTPGFSTAPDWIRELGFGAGMGLNNIKNCADDFSLESEAGKGTVLRVSIVIPDKGEESNDDG
ncbi:MAG: CBS domain-containing protein [Chloroflexota bacterium]